MLLLILDDNTVHALAPHLKIKTLVSWLLRSRLKSLCVFTFLGKHFGMNCMNCHKVWYRYSRLPDRMAEQLLGGLL